MGACVEIRDQNLKGFTLLTTTRVLEMVCVNPVSRRGTTLNPPLWRVDWLKEQPIPPPSSTAPKSPYGVRKGEQGCRGK